MKNLGNVFVLIAVFVCNVVFAQTPSQVDEDSVVIKKTKPLSEMIAVIESHNQTTRTSDALMNYVNERVPFAGSSSENTRLVIDLLREIDTAYGTPQSKCTEKGGVILADYRKERVSYFIGGEFIVIDKHDSYDGEDIYLVTRRSLNGEMNVCVYTKSSMLYSYFDKAYAKTLGKPYGEDASFDVSSTASYRSIFRRTDLLKKEDADWRAAELKEFKQSSSSAISDKEIDEAARKAVEQALDVIGQSVDERVDKQLKPTHALKEGDK